jgi:hypothetical protein
MTKRDMLFSLNIKLRDGAEHAEELLEANVLDHIQSLIQGYNGNTYQTISYNYGDLTRVPSLEDEELDRQLESDTLGILFSSSLLHEICCYKCGCLALTKHKGCLGLLLHLPTDKICARALKVYMIYLFENIVREEVAPSVWGNPRNHHVGQIEQATIDTFSRLLNGFLGNKREEQESYCNVRLPL